MNVYKLAPVPDYALLNGPDSELLGQHIADAAKVADHAHRKQKRRFNGEPYIVHPHRVASSAPLALKPLALLHDVFEDNPEEYPEARLRELFPAWVVDRILFLSHRPGEAYDDYILRILESGDLAVIAVKILDLRDNLSDLKPGSLRDKYRLSLRILGEAP